MIKILVFCLLLIFLLFILRYQSTKMKSSDHAKKLIQIDLIVTFFVGIITNFAFDSLKTVIDDKNNASLGDWGIIVSCVVCIIALLWLIKGHSMMYDREYIPFIIVGVIIVLLSSLIFITMVRNQIDRNTKTEQLKIETEKQEIQEEISTFSYINEELQDEQDYQKLVDDCKLAILRGNDNEAKEIIKQLSMAGIEQHIMDDLKLYYMEHVLQMAALKAEEGLYEVAYEYLYLHEQYFNDATITEQMNTYKKEEILKNIQCYEEQEEYENAITYLKDNADIVKNDMQLIQKQIVYTETLKKQVLSYIEPLVAEQKYQEAIDYLGKYIELLESDEDIQNRMEELEILCPVKLNTVKITNKYGNPMLSGQGSDIWGNEYSDAILLSAQGDGIEFFIGGEYRTLSFTLVLDEKDFEEGYALMRVYKPTGHTAWYKEEYFLEESIVYTDRPKDFNIDVSNVDFITIRLFTSGYDDQSVLIVANAELKR